ncbi:MAG: hypothetical protein HZA58_00670 [Acidimicrobiia bacterium]|nr:hypothetical protein [Acidimicrobiia bacterium]
MARLRHFEHHRFIGLRDTMLVFDTDDPDQARRADDLVGPGGALGRLAVATFAPDSLVEARNRGFRPVPSRRPAP